MHHSNDTQRILHHWNVQLSSIESVSLAVREIMESFFSWIVKSGDAKTEKVNPEDKLSWYLNWLNWRWIKRFLLAPTEHMPLESQNTSLHFYFEFSNLSLFPSFFCAVFFFFKLKSLSKWFFMETKSQKSSFWKCQDSIPSEKKKHFLAASGSVSFRTKWNLIF